ncbi:MAG TPA: hypothetical protein VFY60_08070 [Pyrinomonadaceae bacterium]|nr:hypothetical protein [Pyrinomonadaceae bacterium]
MKKISLFALLTVVLFLSGCGGSSSPSSCTFNNLTPGVWYRVHYVFPTTIPPIVETRIANSSGSITVPSHGYQCYNLTVFAVTNSNLSLSASPSSVNLTSPPGTVTITGQSFDATYAMPRVEYFADGYMVGAVTANSVSGSTSLVAPVPDLSGVYSGTYFIRVTNMTSQGYYLHIVGTATMTGWGNDRPDSDGDGWYDDMDCAPYDPVYGNDCMTYCGGGMEPITICP